MPSHFCLWILSNPGELPTKHCGAPVRYTMKRDDDDRLVRVYATFCDEHQKAADAQDDD